MTQASTGRILAILDLFTEDRLEWTPEEMMETLGYARPTFYRYVKTLRDAGFLARQGRRGLTLGPKMVELDFLMRQSDRLTQAGQPHLAALAAAHPASALLVRWYGNRLLCVASECSTDSPVTSYPRGRPMPLARGAISRAILANLPRRQMMEKIDENLDALRTLGLGQTPDEIAAAFRRLRRDGVVVARGEVTPGVIGIAAPVFDESETPVAALCLTLAHASTDAAGVERLRQTVRDAGALLSAELGALRHDDTPAERRRA